MVKRFLLFQVKIFLQLSLETFLCVLVYDLFIFFFFITLDGRRFREIIDKLAKVSNLENNPLVQRLLLCMPSDKEGDVRVWSPKEASLVMTYPAVDRPSKTISWSDVAKHKDSVDFLKVIPSLGLTTLYPAQAALTIGPTGMLSPWSEMWDMCLGMRVVPVLSVN